MCYRFEQTAQCAVKFRVNAHETAEQSITIAIRAHGDERLSIADRRGSTRGVLFENICNSSHEVIESLSRQLSNR